MSFTEDFTNDQDVEELGNQTPIAKEETLLIWTLEFDGRCPSSGLGVGMVLISPKGEPKTIVFKLEFRNMNKTVEYEALLLGIIATKQKGIKILKAQGDTELIVHQIKGKYFVKNYSLKIYRNNVWDEIKGLDAFLIESIPRR